MKLGACLFHLTSMRRSQILNAIRLSMLASGVQPRHLQLVDTFRPVECEDVSEHKMHSEEIELDASTAELINETRKAGGRIVAVGTTSVRVLESVASFYDGRIEAYQRDTRCF